MQSPSMEASNTQQEKAIWAEDSGDLALSRRLDQRPPEVPFPPSDLVLQNGWAYLSIKWKWFHVLTERGCLAQSMRGMATNISVDTNIIATRTWLSTHQTNPSEEGEKPTHHLRCLLPAAQLSTAAGYSSTGHWEGYIVSEKRKPDFLASPAEHATYFENPLVVLVIYNYQQSFSRTHLTASN